MLATIINACASLILFYLAFSLTQNRGVSLLFGIAGGVLAVLAYLELHDYIRGRKQNGND